MERKQKEKKIRKIDRRKKKCWSKMEGIETERGRIGFSAEIVKLSQQE